jgi:hypothetical protein
MRRECCEITREFSEKEYWFFVRVTLCIGFLFGVIVGISVAVIPLFG